MFACIYGRKISEGVLLRDFAYSFSPLVEETAADTVVIDAEGCELLFGSAYELAKDIVRCGARAKEAGGLGCKVNVALAGNPDAAIHAARFFNGITFISPGEELTALGELPIERLRFQESQVSSFKSQAPHPTAQKQISTSDKKTWDLRLESWDKKVEEILDTLKLWGVCTFLDFAALPTTGVAERLGQEGVRLQQLARGKCERHLNLEEPTPVFANSIELEHALGELEPLSFIFARLLNQLCASLNAYALATNELRVRLKLEHGTSHERTLNLPYPMRDHKVFLKLLLLDTETHPPQAPVVSVSIACEPVKPRVLQNGLFIPLAPEPAKLELTLARLAKLVGPDNVGSPELLDTHRPDAFRLKRFDLKGSVEIRNRRARPKNRQGEIGTRQCLVGFRVFRPSLRAMVEAERGYPTQISAWSKNKSVYGKVVQLAGPWRTTGDWWREDRWARDEWDVVVGSRTASPKSGASQVLYRIYRELSSGWWFVEGMYD